MMTEIPLIAAFITGLLGSVHCVGMCGGIVGSLSLGISPKTKGSSDKIIIFILAYNLGRLSSYVIAGLLVASIGQASSELFNQNAQQIGNWLSSTFMILLGLYIAGWWRLLSVLETMGSYVWRYFQPLGNKLLPVNTYPKALMLGSLWGWLPCGMVYAMLIFSLSSQDTIQGGLIMLSFGLGTLPTLMLLGTAATTMKRFIQQPIVRQLAGSIILLFGVYSLAVSNMHEHHHGGSHQQQR